MKGVFMKAKISTINGMLGSYKYLAMLCLFNTSWISMLLPNYLSEKFNLPIIPMRLVTLLLTSGISYGILNRAHEIWLVAHNEMLARDAYQVQQMFKERAYVDEEELDQIIKVLTDIKNAKPEENKK
jgi:hypothetical protein